MSEEKTNPTKTTGLSLEELIAQCQVAAGLPVKPTEPLDLIMQLLAQELHAALAQGKTPEQCLPMIKLLKRYEALCQRRDALRLRVEKAEAKAKAKAAKAKQSTAPGALSSPAPAPKPVRRCRKVPENMRLRPPGWRR